MLFPLKISEQPRRVVVTGAGIVTAYGLGWESNAEGFRWGRTAFRPVTLFDVSRQRVKRAAEVDLPASLPVSRLNSRKLERSERAAKLLLCAADEALRQADWRNSAATPMVLGTTSGGMSRGEEFFRAASSGDRLAKQATRVTYYLERQSHADETRRYSRTPLVNPGS